MESVFEQMATDSKRNLASTTSLLNERTSDLSSCKLENEQLKVLLLLFIVVIIISVVVVFVIIIFVGVVIIIFVIVKIHIRKSHQ